MPESNILEKQVVHGLHECGRCACKPHGHYDPFVKTVPHVRKVVFGISSSAIQHCQYPLQRSIDVKYFTLPI